MTHFMPQGTVASSYRSFYRVLFHSYIRSRAPEVYVDSSYISLWFGEHSQILRPFLYLFFVSHHSHDGRNAPRSLYETHPTTMTKNFGRESPTILVFPKTFREQCHRAFIYNIHVGIFEIQHHWRIFFSKVYDNILEYEISYFPKVFADP